MPQQPQAASQVVLGPASNGGGDIIHYTGANANATAPNLSGWVDKNGATQGVSFVVNALQQSPAATITGATGGVFSYTSNGLQVSANLPAGGAVEQVPFTVKASGYIQFGAGTYTATVQPLLYASITPGFTAAAANAIFSATAVGCTITAVAALAVPYQLEAHLQGDSASGRLNGWTVGFLPTTSTGATFTAALSDLTAISNIVTSVTYTSSAVPVQFAFGITLAGTASAAPVLNLGAFFIES
jgi:hypothetical protein